MDDADHIERLLSLYDEARHDLKIFMNGVVSYIAEHPDLASSSKNVVHSFKSRLKDRDHLRQKLARKAEAGRNIDENSFFQQITDLAGVRILHIYQEGFASIDAVVRRKIKSGDWALAERAKAYTWDPETVQYFREFDLDVNEKPSSYTSVHYLLKPRLDSNICCELQVRTLFEEI